MTPSEPMWLSPAERQAWRAFALVLFRLPSALDAQLQRDSRLNHFEYAVLAVLSEAPGRTLRMSDLASLSNGSLSRLSHVVKRMERRGWVRREPCAEDGRYINARLTQDGYDKITEAAPGHVRAVRSLIFETLRPEQVEQLHTICAAIGRRMQQESA